MLPSKDFIEKQKAKLLEEKQKIEEEISKLKEFPEYSQNIDDNAQALSEYENNQSIDVQLEMVLTKVKKALKAIDEGTYGVCKKCQSNVEAGRLKIMPYAELCVTCQSQSKK
jgi:RNA polymerase-binding protein DksA